MNRRTHSVARLGAYLLAGATLAGCGQSSVETSSNHSAPTGPEALVFVGNSANGTVSVISHGHDGNTVLNTIPVGSGAVGDINISSEHHVFVNVTSNNQVAAIDPVVTGDPVLKNFLPVGQKPVHGYRDPSDGTLIWVLNDANATNGPCLTARGGAATTSVTVIQNHEVDGGGGGGGSGQATLGIVLEEICVGRGHHKAAFSYPSLTHPNVPRRAFVSNISDGTVTVIDSNPAAATFGDVIATVDLCDPAKRTCDTDLTTNSGAVPHGIDYSPVSGLIYNANVGYGTVWAIDPITPALFDVDSSTPEIDPINVGFANKAHVSPDGRFLVVKGTDTASNPDHVVGRLSVVNLSNHSVHPFNLTDIHPDSFEFSPDGSKLYVTSATSVGKVLSDPADPTSVQIDNASQKAAIKNNVLLSFDASGLPQLPSPIEIPVGVAGHDHRALAIHEHNGVAEHVWVPNPDDGTVSVVDAESDTVVDTVTVGGEPSSIAVLGIE
jgi:YVTN family beta-propeller protein